MSSDRGQQQADVDFILDAWARQGRVLEAYETVLREYFLGHPEERAAWRQRIEECEANAAGLNDLAGELTKAR